MTVILKDAALSKSNCEVTSLLTDFGFTTTALPEKVPVPRWKPSNAANVLDSRVYLPITVVLLSQKECTRDRVGAVLEPVRLMELANRAHSSTRLYCSLWGL